ncbi:MAG: FtsW/RodA/SpoVE family cell cycle protein [Patescibacteria group bacterium]
MPRIASKALFFNYKLFLAAIFLMGLGLLAIYSVSFNDQGFNNFKRQIVFSLIALFVFLAVSRLNYGIWENYARGFYLIGIILMFLVLFIGEKKHGTYGWLGFASYHIQPIEVMKIGVILILAKYFSKVRMDDKRYRHIFISSTYCILPIVLALFQPDFGSAAIIGFIWFLIVLTWGMRRRYLIYMMAAVLLLGVTLWLFFFKAISKGQDRGFFESK